MSAVDAGEVLVVGAGPAGSTLALRLAREGVAVTLLDAATFPRSKPCGDCLSPGASPLLEELGLLERIEARAGGLGGWWMSSARGTAAVGRFGSERRGRSGGARANGGGSPPRKGVAAPGRGLALPRRELDALLLRAALEAGAELREGHRVFGLLRRDERVVGVRARDPAGGERELRAELVVGADGLRSVVARRLGGVERGRREKLALVGRFAGVAPPAPSTAGRRSIGDAPLGEMRFGRDGCLGLAPVGRGRWNVTLVVPLDAGGRIGADRRRFFRDALEAYGVAGRFSGAEAIEELEITGPFEVTPRRRTAPGVLLAGDAAGYFDPLTGQGIQRALETARAAASAARALLAARAGGPGRSPAGGAAETRVETALRRRYEEELGRILAPGRRVQLLLDELAARPGLMDRALALLAARPRLADLLVDVTGDRLSPAALLDPRRLSAALLPSDDRSTSVPTGQGVPCTPTTRP